MVDTIVKYRTLAIAKSFSPVDTGNLRHNAIKLKKVTPDSWTINYSSLNADYIEYVEEGTNNQRAQKFIARTSLILGNYLKNHFNGNPNKRWYRERLQEALSTAENSEERRFRNRQSIMNYYSRN